jgi:hypothetical protein
MSKEAPASTRSSPSSSHIRGRDGAPAPKQPQSSVRPRSSADEKATKNSVDMTSIPRAATRLVEDHSNRRPQAISNGGRLSAKRLINAVGRIANAAMLSANCSGSRTLSTPAGRQTDASIYVAAYDQAPVGHRPSVAGCEYRAPGLNKFTSTSLKTLWSSPFEACFYHTSGINLYRTARR